MKYTRILENPSVLRQRRRDFSTIVCDELQQHETVVSPKSDVFLMEFNGITIHRDGRVRYLIDDSGTYSINDDGFGIGESISELENDVDVDGYVRKISAPSLVIGYYNPIYNNYGHFLIDQLPSLYFQERVLDAGYNNIVVVGVQFDILRDKIREMFSIFLDKRFNVEFIPFCSVELERACFFHGVSRHPSWKSPFIFDFFQDFSGAVKGSKKSGRRIYDFFHNFPSNKASGRKIFVSREDANDRRLLNEKELSRQLEPLGFEVVLGSDLTVRDAVNLFGSAEVVVGVCGASMSNIVFSHPGTTVINIISNEMNGYWYYDLAATMKLQYFDFRGVVDEQAVEDVDGDAPKRKSGNFRIKVDDFIKLLAQVV